jgi:protein-disulfide isomerase
MSAVSTRRGARAARQRQQRRSGPILAAIAAAALAVVVGFVAVQALGSSDSKIPERIASGEGRVLGDEAAPVTVIEYADFQCPVCKRAESSIRAELERDYVQSGQVNIEFRMYPFLGQESFDAALGQEAAR